MCVVGGRCFGCHTPRKLGISNCHASHPPQCHPWYPFSASGTHLKWNVTDQYIVDAKVWIYLKLQVQSHDINTRWPPGCCDTVKKPKLDAHYGMPNIYIYDMSAYTLLTLQCLFSARCHAPVSCIDCSKTFRSPPEFKYV